jgi:carboxymethylenebutenolidase
MNVVTFDTASGSARGELFAPDADHGRSVILVHEYWGLNAHIRDLGRRLAAEGFTVLAVDLFHGKVATVPAEGAKLAGELDTRAAVGEIAAAADYLRGHGAKSVGVLGFCLGGALAIAAACHVPGLSAAVAFYGVPRADKVDYAKVAAPIQAHFGARDPHATVAKAEAVRDAVLAAGGSFELSVYDADHAFVNDTRPAVYSQENAELAWGRMVAFFRLHAG